LVDFEEKAVGTFQKSWLCQLNVREYYFEKTMISSSKMNETSF
jgi:hypothetical protein